MTKNEKVEAMDAEVERHFLRVHDMGMESLFRELVSACEEVAETSKGNLPGVAYPASFVLATRKVQTIVILLEPAAMRRSEEPERWQ